MLARKIESIVVSALLAGGAMAGTVAAQQDVAKAVSSRAISKDRFADADVASFYRDYKLADIKVKTLEPRQVSTSHSYSFTKMAHRSISTTLGTASAPGFSKGFTIVDPRSPTEVRKRCSEAIRPEIEKLGLQLGPSTQVNLGSLRGAGLDLPLPPTGSAGAETTESASGRAEERTRHDQWKVTFSLIYRDIPLSGASRVVILVSGDKLTIESRNLPTRDQLPTDREIDEYHERREKALLQADPTLEWAPAIEVITADFLEHAQRLPTDGPVASSATGNPLTPSVVGQPSLEICLPETGRGRLVYKVALAPKVPTALNPGTEYCVEALSPPTQKPKIFHRVNRVFRFQAAETTHGTVSGNYWYRSSPFRADRLKEMAPMRGVVVEWLDQANQVINKTETDEKGRFFFFGAPNNVNLRAQLSGPRCRVWHGRMGIASIGGSVTLPVKPGGPVIIVFNTPTDKEIAQVSAFLWINEAYEFYKQILPFYSPRLEPVHVIVNDNDIDNCYLEVPKELHLEQNLKQRHAIFQPTNGACADVILHEYAHAIDSMTGDGVKESPAAEYHAASYAEGFADAFVILYKQDLIVGEDLLGKGQHARDYRSSKYAITVEGKPETAELKWGDLQYECYFMQNFGDARQHFGGRIFALFVADLVGRLAKAPGYDLKKAYATVAFLVMRADTFNPPDIPQAVRKMLQMLSDDGSIPNPAKRLLLQEMRAAASGLKIPL
jgi:hypothetical protein